MCGIVGIIASESPIDEYRSRLGSMVEALKHRGPDEQGQHFFSEQCAFGHTRLSIVDLKTGQQPMLTPDQTVGVTFNGELYGYQEIRQRLSYPFKTNSDTEVLLALYRNYGEEMVAQVPGMFAFALWDNTEKKLICARDRFGEKPFYYAVGGNGEFVFGSEIKSILASGLVTPILDKEMVAYYLRHLYIHPTRTVYKNIFTLPPAHRLVYQRGKIAVSRYWQFPTVNSAITLTDAKDRFADLLSQAVRKQLVADVPVGAFLSGGLDSSTITALASRFVPHLKTFSFAFEGGLDESNFAREVAQKYGTDHTELSAATVDVASILQKMTQVYDEPFADSSNIPTYILAGLAKQHATVVLTGDGGDELLGGYAQWYQPLLTMSQLRPSLKEYMSWFAKCITSLITLQKSQAWYRYKGWRLKKQYPSIMAAHESQNTYFSSRDILNLGLKIPAVARDSGWVPLNTLDDAMRMDLENYMPGDILVKTDRAAMAHALELRAPFLDVDFAEFCLSLSYTLKINGREEKIILREACRSLWPMSVQKRSKQGFGAPVERWLQLAGVQKLKEEYLFNKDAKLWKIIPFEQGQEFAQKDSYQTWTLLVLSMWAEAHSFNI